MRTKDIIIIAGAIWATFTFFAKAYNAPEKIESKVNLVEKWISGHEQLSRNYIEMQAKQTAILESLDNRLSRIEKIMDARIR